MQKKYNITTYWVTDNIPFHNKRNKDDPERKSTITKTQVNKESRIHKKLNKKIL